MSPYPYTSISSIQLETRLVIPGNVFSVINVGIDRPKRGITFCVVQSTRVHDNLRKGLRLSHFMILVSHRWSRSCTIFSGSSDVVDLLLPDSRCSRYTREMVVRENPNFITTSEMLCPISRAPNIAPRSNSLNLDNLSL
ncbi:uncharacterized protein TNCV_4233201 [Trichonephila clavipes]|nr:uncharacterized protein TNCV_4233201 [Trichonephila clavipes]